MKTVIDLQKHKYAKKDWRFIIYDETTGEDPIECTTKIFDGAIVGSLFDFDYQTELARLFTKYGNRKVFLGWQYNTIWRNIHRHPDLIESDSLLNFPSFSPTNDLFQVVYVLD